jgi:hypothetical protein
MSAFPDAGGGLLGPGAEELAGKAIDKTPPHPRRRFSEWPEGFREVRVDRRNPKPKQRFCGPLSTFVNKFLYNESLWE